MNEELLDTLQVATVYGLTPECIRRWRMLGAGPRFIRLGRSVRYRREEVEAFARRREFASTTEADVQGAA